MARPRGHYKSLSHGSLATAARNEYRTFGTGAHGGAGPGISVQLDLRPLANAIRYIGNDKLNRGQVVSRAINRGLERFKGAAHRELKVLTKIRQPTRLKKGVSLKFATPATLTGIYTIRDRNIRITRAYFGARYSPFGTPGANARWGRGASPIGATWTSWDGARTGKSTFMIPGKNPVFIRLGKVGRFPLHPVYGPNPAQLMRIHAPGFMSILRSAADAYIKVAIERAYRESEARAKAMFGL
ncbi:hypothetical protein [uncultured Hyphomicrobium sp.]|uniref:hypothetical protein n=1 Tax=uncultured Hyphomicrobium sp. TaxID=194373 RepID=UPI0025F58809|nr:hypothetical protein [uncultured Hyphomicrobium sp.]